MAQTVLLQSTQQATGRYASAMGCACQPISVLAKRLIAPPGQALVLRSDAGRPTQGALLYPGE